jgi:coenzyme PQQ synthesis protein D (PqqD)
VTGRATETPAGSQLQPDTVLRRLPSPAVDWVDVGGQVVAWADDAASLHLLDPIASLVFLLIDGETTLGVTAAELAESFGTSVEQVEPDVLRFAESLSDLGIVERVP